MVDVSQKEITARTAAAQGEILLSKACFDLLKDNPKGDVYGTARIAGIMAAKKCSDLIPLCHPLPVTSVSVDFQTDPQKLSITAFCSVKCTGKTGVEMEALCGCTTALLTLYDMLKAADHGMVISDVHLVTKTGGKSGDFQFSKAG